jgi:predicted dithiol-disulfide oxidoreductase (DUF899 family)
MAGMAMQRVLASPRLQAMSFSPGRGHTFAGLVATKEESMMTDHRVGTRDEWLAARIALLEREKELTRLSDELAQRRRELPWVPLEKRYEFETNDGTKTLPELFDGQSQLLVYHFMFGPSVEGWPEAGCPGCSYTADSLDGAVAHLPHRDVTFVAVSRAPLERLNAYKRRMGWSFPWVSFGESDFNLDFAVFTEEERRTGKGFNFGTPKHADINLRETELHGLSALALESGVVYHTYSTYDRGTDVLNATWQLLDRTPKGRGDEFEGWPGRHDEYKTPGTKTA